MKKHFSVLIYLLFAISGCHRPLSHPESVDLIYLDIKKDAAQVLAKIDTTEKGLENAKRDVERAPIRTGQREDAEDAYFKQVHKLQRLKERYRYLTAKARVRFRFVQKDYVEVFEKKLPWPNTEEYENYLVEKRLSDAPREWNPDLSIKKRALAQAKAASAAAHAEGKGHSEAEHH